MRSKPKYAERRTLVAVYHPPRPDLPYLAVTIFPSGHLEGLAFATAEKAEEVADEVWRHLSDIADEDDKAC